MLWTYIYWGNTGRDIGLMDTFNLWVYSLVLKIRVTSKLFSFFSWLGDESNGEGHGLIRVTVILYLAFFSWFHHNNLLIRSHYSPASIQSIGFFIRTGIHFLTKSTPHMYTHLRYCESLINGKIHINKSLHLSLCRISQFIIKLSLGCDVFSTLSSRFSSWSYYIGYYSKISQFATLEEGKSCPVKMFSIEF